MTRVVPTSGLHESQAGDSHVAFEQQVAKAWPTEQWCNCHVLLAVSGGVDSVAMLRGMVAIKRLAGGTGKLIVGHLNHCLRGADGDADANWLESLCEKLTLPLESAKADVAALACVQRDGWEAAARSMRYDFFQSTAERLGARFVVMAHTADDQAETILHRIIRGTGLAGLAGIPQRRELSPSVTLVRPLLGISRREIENYLGALGQEYRVDRSNDSPRFTRNRVRHELLPHLRELNSDVDGALTRLATQAAEVQAYLESTATRHIDNCIECEYMSVADDVMSPGSKSLRRLRVNCAGLDGLPAVILREVFKGAWQSADWPLQSMGFAEWQSLASLATSSAACVAVTLPGNVIARRDSGWLVLERRGLS